MEFGVETIGDLRIITLPGDTLEAGNTHEFKRDITPLLEGGKRVILAMDRIGFIDSSGCGALLFCLRTVQTHGGGLAIYGLSLQIMGILKAIQMDRKVAMYVTREEALAGMRGLTGEGKRSRG